MTTSGWGPSGENFCSRRALIGEVAPTSDPTTASPWKSQSGKCPIFDALASLQVSPLSQWSINPIFRFQLGLQPQPTTVSLSQHFLHFLTFYSFLTFYTFHTFYAFSGIYTFQTFHGFYAFYTCHAMGPPWAFLWIWVLLGLFVVVQEPLFLYFRLQNAKKQL